MSFRNRIFTLFLGFSLLTLIILGVVMIEKIHRDMINNEIETLSNYEVSINNSIKFLLNNSSMTKTEDKLKLIRDYLYTSNRESIYFEVYSGNGLAVQTHNIKWQVLRPDVTTAHEEGKNYFLKKMDDRYFLFVSNKLYLNEEELVVSLIKDLSTIMKSRSLQYQFYIPLSLIVLAILMVSFYQVSKFITKDISKLTKVTASIKDGEYQARTEFTNNDEIGLIGQHIDAMASVIEGNIQVLEAETVSKQRFIDNFTHELKTPLTSIIGYSDLLIKSKYNKSVFDKGLYHIHDEGVRLSKLSTLMNEILIAKSKSLELSKENIQEILMDVKDINDMRRYGKPLHIKVEGEAIVMMIDKHLLKLALVNLVDNAIKASKENDEILLSVEKLDGVINISVKDQGSGISEEDLRHIREPFYKADEARHKDNTSFGLGLSICTQVVDALGAQLVFDSQPGLGTTVVIKFEFTTS